MRMRWAGLVTRMGERCGAYRVFVGNEGKRPLGMSRLRFEDNIKMYLQEIEMGPRLDWSGSQ